MCVWHPNCTCTLGKGIRQEEREKQHSSFPATWEHWFCGRTGLLYLSCSLHQRGAALPRLHILLTDCKCFSSNFPLPVIHPAPLHWHNWLTHHPSQRECAAAIPTLGKRVTNKQIRSDVSALRPQNSVHPVNFMDEYKVKGNKSIFP